MREIRWFLLQKFWESLGTCSSIQSKKAKPTTRVNLALQVGMTGFEPATTRPPDEYSTGLSYIPIFGAANIERKISGSKNK
jgi:hypothetical protein